MKLMKAISRYSMIVVVAAASVAVQTWTARADDAQTRDKYRTRTTPNKASDIIGIEVRNAQNEKLGKVEDLIVDLASGRISYAILSMGGVLGIGDKLVLVPANQFSYALSEKKLTLNTSKEVLQNAPRFEKGKWPDLNDPRWDDEAGKYYKDNSARNYSDGDVENTRRNVQDGVGTEVDNSRRNTRDRDGATLLPGDQGNNEVDRVLTQQIRKALVKDSQLSLIAKNVKIISANGTVTLRGVVKTEQEKTDIAAKAKQVAGDIEVDNQLEVKNP
jgi:sporulation protein YlmC with PRC-barrel domain